MTACLLVAGALRAALPAASFTLEWRHSIEHTRWRETWVADARGVSVTEAWIEGQGAGMDTGPGARFDGEGWSWRPALPPRREVVLTLSPYTADYTLCAGGHCAPLHAWVGAPAEATGTVAVTACDATPTPPPR